MSRPRLGRDRVVLYLTAEEEVELRMLLAGLRQPIEWIEPDPHKRLDTKLAEALITDPVLVGKCHREVDARLKKKGDGGLTNMDEVGILMVV